MSEKDGNKDKPKVHKNLEGFNIKINSFGEIESNLNTDKINEFLDKNMEGKEVEDPKDGWQEEEE